MLVTGVVCISTYDLNDVSTNTCPGGSLGTGVSAVIGASFIMGFIMGQLASRCKYVA